MDWEAVCEKKPRKKRSIGYLTKRILDELPNEVKPEESWEIQIEQIMNHFNASKGSVYEVFHVFEALLLVTKVGKNTFRWYGFQYLTQTLCFLRSIGVLTNVGAEIQLTKEKEIQEMVERNHTEAVDAVESIQENENFVNSLPIYDGDQNILLHPGTSSTCTSSHEKKPQLHILTVCQKFIILFLVSDAPQVMSLEFASKVIHGTDFPAKVQKSKARRLYDVSNVLLAISQRFPIMQKVNTTLLNSGRRTAFQYIGPNVQEMLLDTNTIIRLPPYRKKHLLFDEGKRLLHLPILPEKIPGLFTVRLKTVEEQPPWPIDQNHGLDTTKATLYDLKQPLSFHDLARLEAKRLGCKIEFNEESGSNQTDHAVPNQLGDELIQLIENSSEKEISVELPMENLRFAILPEESKVLSFL